MSALGVDCHCMLGGTPQMDDLSYTIPETIERIRSRIAVSAVVMITAAIMVSILHVALS